MREVGESARGVGIVILVMTASSIDQSLSFGTLRTALRHAEDGLPAVSTYTIWHTLHAAGLSWQQRRTWCSTGVVMRRSKQGGAVAVSDGDALAKKS